MAAHKSIRSGVRARRARHPAKQDPQSRPGTENAPTAPDKGRAPTWNPGSEHHRFLCSLENHRLRLKLVYGTLRTAELALRKQRAEQDEEIADCLKEVALWTLGNQIAFARDLVERFGGWPPASATSGSAAKGAQT